jgi:hypothetical protein
MYRTWTNGLKLIDDATVCFPSLESQPRLQFPTPYYTPRTSSSAFVDLSNEAPSTQHDLNYYMPQRFYPQQQSPFNVDYQQQLQASIACCDSQTLLSEGSQAQQSPLSMNFQGQKSPLNAPLQPWKSLSGSPHAQQQSPLNMSRRQQGSLSGLPRQWQQSASSVASASGANQSMNDFGKDLLKLDQLVITVLQQAPLKTVDCVTSEIIDTMTYKIHNVCIQTDLLNVAAKYAVMFSETKLRALALLNFMATWWLLRERVVHYLGKMGVNINDTAMQSGIKDAVATVSEMMGKIMGKDDGTAGKEKASMGVDKFQ